MANREEEQRAAHPPPRRDGVGRGGVSTGPQLTGCKGAPHLEAALGGDGEVRFDSQNPVRLFSSRGPSGRWLEMETQSLERGLGSARGQE